MSKTFSRRDPVANFSLISRKMAELFSIHFFIFHYTGFTILQKFKCMFWDVLKVALENECYHWIPELKLHLIDTFLIDFGHI